MGAFIGGLILGILAGIAIASRRYKRKFAEVEREKQSALRQQRELLERERELQMRSLRQRLQADCERQLQAQEVAWSAKLAALETRSRQEEFAPVPSPEPMDDFQQYESLLDLLDDEEELESRDF